MSSTPFKPSFGPTFLFAKTLQLSYTLRSQKQHPILETSSIFSLSRTLDIARFLSSDNSVLTNNPFVPFIHLYLSSVSTLKKTSPPLSSPRSLCPSFNLFTSLALTTPSRLIASVLGFPQPWPLSQIPHPSSKSSYGVAGLRTHTSITCA